MEKYSVLMSLYIKEKPEYLTEAIESMVNQTLKPDEIIIVKDGPITFQLQEVLDHFTNRYPNLFNIIGYETNRGLGLALNFGLNHCKNDLVARMDTDDISKLDRCEKQVLFFENHPEISILGSAIDEFNGNINNITGRRVVPITSDEIYTFAKRRSAFNHPTVMYKKSDVLKFGGYDDLKRNQDVDLFGRMLYGGCLASNFENSLLWFRADDDLAKRRKSWENSRSYINTIKKFWKMGYASFVDYLVVAMGQSIMYICPIGLQKILYKKFLRS
ncbi:glycosyltransferase [Vagococcus humatus]|uniref:Glycosyl transferase n=1 Tax=Vagococcus humatus TaxID=1889241 RepID=A0A3S0GEH0_9ENTE|nr:glycosyltransferase [Vagococcus humatus]RST89906.1 glycosyl transferase [Vagococcus humatus]